MMREGQRLLLLLVLNGIVGYSALAMPMTEKLGCCVLETDGPVKTLKNCENCGQDNEIVDFSGEDINDIEDGAFDNSTNSLMRDLILTGNSISVLRKGMFLGLGNLKFLEVKANELTIIRDDALDHLTSLTTFDVVDNEIVELPPRLLRDNPTINDFRASDNLIEYLDPYFLEGVGGPNYELRLTQNKIDFLWIDFFEVSVGFLKVDFSTNVGKAQSNCPDPPNDRPDPPGFQEVRFLERSTPEDQTSGIFADEVKFCYAYFRDPTPSPTVSPSPSMTPTPSISESVTPSSSESATLTSTRTPTSTYTPTRTPSGTSTRTPSQSRTSTGTSTPSPSSSPSSTVSASASPDLVIGCCRAFEYVLTRCDCPDVEVLDLSCNDLEGIATGAFDSPWDNGNIDTLILNDNVIDHIEPGAFVGLHSLRTLSLTKNKLQKLDDDDFLGLGNVTNIFLNENQLQDIAGGTFAEVYGLEVLFLHDNLLESLNGSTFENNPYLEVLDLDRNKLIALPNTLVENNTCLTYLNLGEPDCPAGNNPGLSGCPCPLDEVPPKTLQSDLSYYSEQFGLVTTPKFCFAPPLCCGITAEGELKYCRCEGTRLNLAGKNITTLNENAFYFSENENLEELYLHKNLIRAIPDLAFNGLGNLQTLMLADNAIELLVKDSFYGLESLRNLYLHENLISNLPQCAFFSRTLEKLVLNDNNITDVTTHQFDGVSEELEAMYLRNNKIKSIEFLVAHSFSENFMFTSLEMNPGYYSCGNYIGHPHYFASGDQVLPLLLPAQLDALPTGGIGYLSSVQFCFSVNTTGSHSICGCC